MYVFKLIIRETTNLQIRPLPGTVSSLIVNGSDTPSFASSTSSTKYKTPSPPSQPNHYVSAAQEQSGMEDVVMDNGEHLMNNPRGGVIGRTPTPPSAPTPVYEKDARYAKHD